MSMINMFKRKCDYCGKTVDKDACISIVKGEKHICKKCAGDIVKKQEVKQTNLLTKKLKEKIVNAAFEELKQSIVECIDNAIYEICDHSFNNDQLEDIENCLKKKCIEEFRK